MDDKKNINADLVAGLTGKTPEEHFAEVEKSRDSYGPNSINVEIVKGHYLSLSHNKLVFGPIRLIDKDALIEEVCPFHDAKAHPKLLAACTRYKLFSSKKDAAKSISKALGKFGTFVDTVQRKYFEDIKLSSKQSNQNTTTSNYLTTSNYKLQSWGGFIPELKLYVEQIEGRKYLYNFDGKYGIAKIQEETIGDSKVVHSFLIFGKTKIYFKSTIIQDAVYSIPSLQKVEDFIAKKLKPRPFKDIIADVVGTVSVLYDFEFKTDLYMIQLNIGQSYLVPALSNLFYLTVDSTLGSGKTTLLENMAALVRHGFVGGDTSPAVIPRYVDELQISLAIDELDQKIGEKGQEEVTSILRKGQRRGNPYIRCEGRNNIPKAYDIFGNHMCSYRSELEDAFMSRSIAIHTSKTKDNRLPVLNVHKRELLKPFADELFFWGMENLYNIWLKWEQKRSDVVSCSDVVRCSGDLEPTEKNKIRESLYNQITSDLDKDDAELLQSVTGRNSELCYLALQISKMLELDIRENLSTVLKSKEEDEAMSGNYYLEALENFMKLLVEDESNQDRHIKGDGTHSGCIYFPKNKIYQRFVQNLISLNVHTIGTKKYNSLLKDLGFIQGDTIMNIRLDGVPKMCLIITEKIRARIVGKPDEDQQIKKINQEPVGEQNKQPTIHHKCTFCGSAQSDGWTSDGNKPACKGCLKSLEAHAK
jgi:hypothetical protein